MKRDRKRPGSGTPAPLRLEDALYAVVKREVESGQVRQDTWETAVRLSNGNDNRAIAAYIRLRVRALLEAHESRQR